MLCYMCHSNHTVLAALPLPSNFFSSLSKSFPEARIQTNFDNPSVGIVELYCVWGGGKPQLFLKVSLCNHISMRGVKTLLYFTGGV